MNTLKFIVETEGKKIYIEDSFDFINLINSALELDEDFSDVLNEVLDAWECHTIEELSKYYEFVLEDLATPYTYTVIDKWYKVA